MCCIEESICDIVGLFATPEVIQRSGNCEPLPPSLRPWSGSQTRGPHVALEDIVCGPQCVLRIFIQSRFKF